MTTNYFEIRRGFSWNEGGTPANITVLWGGRPKGFYIYLFGLRLHWFI